MVAAAAYDVPLDRLGRRRADAKAARQLEADELAAEADRLRAWTPLPGLPGPTRASCPPPTEPCRYVQCRHHLARIESEQRPGRRGGGRRLPEPTFRPIWLDASAPTCSIHIANAIAEGGEPMQTRDAGHVMGICERQAHALVVGGLAKLGIGPADVAAIAHDVEVAPRRRAARDARATNRATFTPTPARVVGAVRRLHAHGLGAECSGYRLAWRFGARVYPILDALVADGRLHIADVIIRGGGITGAQRVTVYAPGRGAP